MPSSYLSSFFKLLLLLSPVMAQTQYSILQYSSSALPDCAKGCTTLTNAAGSCLPPAAPITQAEIYKSCFCQSALLTTLYSSPNGVCDAACASPSDLTKVRTWYTSWCTGTELPVASGAPAASSAARTSAQVTSTSTATRAPSASGPPPSWVAGHWRYIILIVVLVLLIGGGAVFGVWFTRRRRAKRSAEVLDANAPVVWGPFQAQNHTEGFNYVDSYEAMPIPPISEKARRGTGSTSVRDPPQSADNLVPEQSRWSDGSNKWWKRQR